jgi:hypothetical protein
VLAPPACNSKRAKEQLDEARASIPKKAIGRYLDHKIDSHVAVRTTQAEAMLTAIRRIRHLIRDSDELDEAISALEADVQAAKDAAV